MVIAHIPTTKINEKTAIHATNLLYFDNHYVLT